MPAASLIANQAYLTADTPGIGGVIKQRPEDFIVEELPLYPPCGSGEHLYLCIEKRGRATTDALRRIAKLFAVAKSDIGYAGLKDKQAVTRQHISVRLPNPSDDAELLARLAHTDYKLLWSARHTNKLRRGHLAGNRFTILVRQTDPDAAPRARAILDRLAAQGVPNFIGAQRFGYKQNNHILGQLLLLGRWQELLDLMLGHPDEGESPGARDGRAAYERRDYTAALDAWPHHLHNERRALDLLRQRKTPEQVVLGLDPAQRDFLISSLQSAMFNKVLDRRLRDPGAPPFPRLLEGDLAWKHDSGAVFLVDKAAAELENASGGRIEAHTISPSGPMWGASMAMPAGLPAAWEQEALSEFGLRPADFVSGPHGVAHGVRRSMRAIITRAEVSDGTDEHGAFVRVAFDLPPGCFATIVLREIMKPEGCGATLAQEPEEDRGARGGAEDAERP